MLRMINSQLYVFMLEVNIYFVIAVPLHKNNDWHPSFSGDFSARVWFPGKANESLSHCSIEPKAKVVLPSHRFNQGRRVASHSDSFEQASLEELHF